MATTTPSTISIKLLVNKTTGKVLFAEASKDFVDFLLSLLALPIGAVIQLLTEARMVGSLGKLYASLQALNTTYVQPGFNKQVLLHPRAAVAKTSSCFFLKNSSSDENEDNSNNGVHYYCCTAVHDNMCFSDVYGTRCSCGRHMTTCARFSSNSQPGPAVDDKEGVGFVQGVVTYMVTDDLVVSPMSTISGISLLNKFNVKELGTLNEMTVEVNMDMGLKLLEVSLRSSSVLTDVLLKSNKECEI